MGPLKKVHTPRLSFLMRGAQQPYVRQAVVRHVKPASMPTITGPWGASGLGATVLPYDPEHGASMAPRSNPAFNDLWVIGATGGASKVIPQGIDYSRTPCCTTGLGGLETTPLFIGLVGVPLALLAIGWLFGGSAMASRMNPAAKYIIMGRYRGGRKERIDEFPSQREANKMLQEYSLAYGPDFELWIEGPEARRRNSGSCGIKVGDTVTYKDLSLHFYRGEVTAVENKFAWVKWSQPGFLQFNEPAKEWMENLKVVRS